jgi:hypothetical protein
VSASQFEPLLLGWLAIVTADAELLKWLGDGPIEQRSTRETVERIPGLYYSFVDAVLEENTETILIDWEIYTRAIQPAGEVRLFGPSEAANRVADRLRALMNVDTLPFILPVPAAVIDGVAVTELPHWAQLLRDFGNDGEDEGYTRRLLRFEYHPPRVSA